MTNPPDQSPRRLRIKQSVNHQHLSAVERDLVDRVNRQIGPNFQAKIVLRPSATRVEVAKRKKNDQFSVPGTSKTVDPEAGKHLREKVLVVSQVDTNGATVRETHFKLETASVMGPDLRSGNLYAQHDMVAVQNVIMTPTMVLNDTSRSRLPVIADKHSALTGDQFLSSADVAVRTIVGSIKHQSNSTMHDRFSELTQHYPTVAPDYRGITQLAGPHLDPNQSKMAAGLTAYVSVERGPGMQQSVFDALTSSDNLANSGYQEGASASTHAGFQAKERRHVPNKNAVLIIHSAASMQGGLRGSVGMGKDSEGNPTTLTSMKENTAESAGKSKTERKKSAEKQLQKREAVSQRQGIIPQNVNPLVSAQYREKTGAVPAEGFLGVLMFGSKVMAPGGVDEKGNPLPEYAAHMDAVGSGGMVGSFDAYRMRGESAFADEITLMPRSANIRDLRIVAGRGAFVPASGGVIATWGQSAITGETIETRMPNMGNRGGVKITSHILSFGNDELSARHIHDLIQSPDVTLSYIHGLIKDPDSTKKGHAKFKERIELEQKAIKNLNSILKSSVEKEYAAIDRTSMSPEDIAQLEKDKQEDIRASVIKYDKKAVGGKREDTALISSTSYIQTPDSMKGGGFKAMLGHVETDPRSQEIIKSVLNGRAPHEISEQEINEVILPKFVSEFGLKKGRNQQISDVALQTLVGNSVKNVLFGKGWQKLQQDKDIEEISQRNISDAQKSRLIKQIKRGKRAPLTPVLVMTHDEIKYTRDLHLRTILTYLQQSAPDSPIGSGTAPDSAVARHIKSMGEMIRSEYRTTGSSASGMDQEREIEENIRFLGTTEKEASESYERRNKAFSNIVTNAMDYGGRPWILTSFPHVNSEPMGTTNMVNAPFARAITKVSPELRDYLRKNNTASKKISQMLAPESWSEDEAVDITAEDFRTLIPSERAADEHERFEAVKRIYDNAVKRRKSTKNAAMRLTIGTDEKGNPKQIVLASPYAFSSLERSDPGTTLTRLVEKVQNRGASTATIEQLEVIHRKAVQQYAQSDAGQKRMQNFSGEGVNAMALRYVSSPDASPGKVLVGNQDVDSVASGFGISSKQMIRAMRSGQKFHVYVQRYPQSEGSGAWYELEYRKKYKGAIAVPTEANSQFAGDDDGDLANFMAGFRPVTYRKNGKMSTEFVPLPGVEQAVIDQGSAKVTALNRFASFYGFKELKSRIEEARSQVEKYMTDQLEHTQEFQDHMTATYGKIDAAKDPEMYKRAFETERDRRAVDAMVSGFNFVSETTNRGYHVRKLNLEFAGKEQNTQLDAETKMVPVRAGETKGDRASIISNALGQYAVESAPQVIAHQSAGEGAAKRDMGIYTIVKSLQYTAETPEHLKAIEKASFDIYGENPIEGLGRSIRPHQNPYASASSQALSDLDWIYQRALDMLPKHEETKNFTKSFFVSDINTSEDLFKRKEMTENMLASFLLAEEVTPIAIGATFARRGNADQIKFITESAQSIKDEIDKKRKESGKEVTLSDLRQIQKFNSIIDGHGFDTTAYAEDANSAVAATITHQSYINTIARINSGKYDDATVDQKEKINDALKSYLGKIISNPGTFRKDWETVASMSREKDPTGFWSQAVDQAGGMEHLTNMDPVSIADMFGIKLEIPETPGEKDRQMGKRMIDLNSFASNPVEAFAKLTGFGTDMIHPDISVDDETQSKYRQAMGNARSINSSGKIEEGKPRGFNARASSIQSIVSFPDNEKDPRRAAYQFADVGSQIYKSSAVFEIMNQMAVDLLAGNRTNTAMFRDESLPHGFANLSLGKNEYTIFQQTNQQMRGGNRFEEDLRRQLIDAMNNAAEESLKPGSTRTKPTQGFLHMSGISLSALDEPSGMFFSGTPDFFRMIGEKPKGEDGWQLNLQVYDAKSTSVGKALRNLGFSIEDIEDVTRDKLNDVGLSDDFGVYSGQISSYVYLAQKMAKKMRNDAAKAAGRALEKKKKPSSSDPFSDMEDDAEEEGSDVEFTGSFKDLDIEGVNVKSKYAQHINRLTEMLSEQKVRMFNGEGNEMTHREIAIGMAEAMAAGRIEEGGVIVGNTDKSGKRLFTDSKVLGKINASGLTIKTLLQNNLILSSRRLPASGPQSVEGMLRAFPRKAKQIAASDAGLRALGFMYHAIGLAMMNKNELLGRNRETGQIDENGTYADLSPLFGVLRENLSADPVAIRSGFSANGNPFGDDEPATPSGYRRSWTTEDEEADETASVLSTMMQHSQLNAQQISSMEYILRGFARKADKTGSISVQKDGNAIVGRSAKPVAGKFNYLLGDKADELREAVTYKNSANENVIADDIALREAIIGASAEYGNDGKTTSVDSSIQDKYMLSGGVRTNRLSYISTHARNVLNPYSNKEDAREILKERLAAQAESIQKLHKQAELFDADDYAKLTDMPRSVDDLSNAAIAELIHNRSMSFHQKLMDRYHPQYEEIGESSIRFDNNSLVGYDPKTGQIGVRDEQIENKVTAFRLNSRMFSIGGMMESAQMVMMRMAYASLQTMDKEGKELKRVFNQKTNEELDDILNPSGESKRNKTKAARASRARSEGIGKKLASLAKSFTKRSKHIYTSKDFAQMPKGGAGINDTNFWFQTPVTNQYEGVGAFSTQSDHRSWFVSHHLKPMHAIAKGLMEMGIRSNQWKKENVDEEILMGILMTHDLMKAKTTRGDLRKKDKEAAAGRKYDPEEDKTPAFDMLLKMGMSKEKAEKVKQYLSDMDAVKDPKWWEKDQKDQDGNPISIEDKIKSLSPEVRIASTADAISHRTKGRHGFLNIFSRLTNRAKDKPSTLQKIAESNKNKSSKDSRKILMDIGDVKRSEVMSDAREAYDPITDETYVSGFASDIAQGLINKFGDEQTKSIFDKIKNAFGDKSKFSTIDPATGEMKPFNRTGKMRGGRLCKGDIDIVGEVEKESVFSKENGEMIVEPGTKRNKKETVGEFGQEIISPGEDGELYVSPNSAIKRKDSESYRSQQRIRFGFGIGRHEGGPVQKETGAVVGETSEENWETELYKLAFSSVSKEFDTTESIKHAYRKELEKTLYKDDEAITTRGNVVGLGTGKSKPEKDLGIKAEYIELPKNIFPNKIISWSNWQKDVARKTESHLFVDENNVPEIDILSFLKDYFSKDFSEMPEFNYSDEPEEIGLAGFYRFTGDKNKKGEIVLNKNLEKSFGVEGLFVGLHELGHFAHFSSIGFDKNHPDWGYSRNKIIKKELVANKFAKHYGKKIIADEPTLSLFNQRVLLAQSDYEKYVDDYISSGFDWNKVAHADGGLVKKDRSYVVGEHETEEYARLVKEGYGLDEAGPNEGIRPIPLGGFRSISENLLGVEAEGVEVHTEGPAAGRAKYAEWAAKIAKRAHGTSLGVDVFDMVRSHYGDILKYLPTMRVSDKSRDSYMQEVVGKHSSFYRSPLPHWGKLFRAGKNTPKDDAENYAGVVIAPVSANNSVEHLAILSHEIGHYEDDFAHGFAEGTTGKPSWRDPESYEKWMETEARASINAMKNLKQLLDPEKYRLASQTLLRTQVLYERTFDLQESSMRGETFDDVKNTYVSYREKAKVRRSSARAEGGPVESGSSYVAGELEKETYKGPAVSRQGGWVEKDGIEQWDPSAGDILPISQQEYMRAWEESEKGFFVTRDQGIALRKAPTNRYEDFSSEWNKAGYFRFWDPLRAMGEVAGIGARKLGAAASVPFGLGIGFGIGAFNFFKGIRFSMPQGKGFRFPKISLPKFSFDIRMPKWAGMELGFKSGNGGRFSFSLPKIKFPKFNFFPGPDQNKRALHRGMLQDSWDLSMERDRRKEELAQSWASQVEGIGAPYDEELMKSQDEELKNLNSYVDISPYLREKYKDYRRSSGEKRDSVVSDILGKINQGLEADSQWSKEDVSGFMEVERWKRGGARTGLIGGLIGIGQNAVRDFAVDAVDFAKSVPDLAQKAAGFAKGKIESIGNAFSGFREKVGNRIESFASGFRAFSSRVLNTSKDVFGTAQDFANSLIRGYSARFGSGTENRGLIGAFEDGSQAIKNRISGIATFASEKSQQFLQMGQEFAENGFGNLRRSEVGKFARSAISEVIGFGNRANASISAFVRPVLMNAKYQIKSANQFIQDTSRSIFSNVQKEIENFPVVAPLVASVFAKKISDDLSKTPFVRRLRSVGSSVRSEVIGFGNRATASINASIKPFLIAGRTQAKSATRAVEKVKSGIRDAGFAMQTAAQNIWYGNDYPNGKEETEEGFLKVNKALEEAKAREVTINSAAGNEKGTKTYPIGEDDEAVQSLNRISESGYATEGDIDQAMEAIQNSPSMKNAGITREDVRGYFNARAIESRGGLKKGGLNRIVQSAINYTKQDFEAVKNFASKSINFASESINSLKTRIVEGEAPSFEQSAEYFSNKKMYDSMSDDDVSDSMRSTKRYFEGKTGLRGMINHSIPEGIEKIKDKVSSAFSSTVAASEKTGGNLQRGIQRLLWGESSVNKWSPDMSDADIASEMEKDNVSGGIVDNKFGGVLGTLYNIGESAKKSMFGNKGFMEYFMGIDLIGKGVNAAKSAATSFVGAARVAGKKIMDSALGRPLRAAARVFDRAVFEAKGVYSGVTGKKTYTKFGKGIHSLRRRFGLKNEGDYRVNKKRGETKISAIERVLGEKGVALKDATKEQIDWARTVLGRRGNPDTPFPEGSAKPEKPAEKTDAELEKESGEKADSALAMLDDERPETSVEGSDSAATDSTPAGDPGKTAATVDEEEAKSDAQIQEMLKTMFPDGSMGTVYSGNIEGEGSRKTDVATMFRGMLFGQYKMSQKLGGGVGGILGGMFGGSRKGASGKWKFSPAAMRRLFTKKVKDDKGVESTVARNDFEDDSGNLKLPGWSNEDISKMLGSHEIGSKEAEGISHLQAVNARGHRATLENFDQGVKFLETELSKAAPGSAENEGIANMLKTVRNMRNAKMIMGGRTSATTISGLTHDQVIEKAGALNASVQDNDKYTADFKKNMKAFTDELVKGSNVMKGLNENIDKLTATTTKAYETVKSVAETRDRMRQHADTLEKAGYGSTEEGRQAIALAREKQYEAQSQLNKGSDLYESIRSKHGDKVADEYFAEFGASKSKRTLAQRFKDPMTAMFASHFVRDMGMAIREGIMPTVNKATEYGMTVDREREYLARVGDSSGRINDPGSQFLDVRQNWNRGMARDSANAIAGLGQNNSLSFLRGANQALEPGISLGMGLAGLNAAGITTLGGPAILGLAALATAATTAAYTHGAARNPKEMAVASLIGESGGNPFERSLFTGLAHLFSGDKEKNNISLEEAKARVNLSQETLDNLSKAIEKERQRNPESKITDIEREGGGYYRQEIPTAMTVEQFNIARPSEHFVRDGVVYREQTTYFEGNLSEFREKEKQEQKSNIERFEKQKKSAEFDNFEARLAKRSAEQTDVDRASISGYTGKMASFDSSDNLDDLPFQKSLSSGALDLFRESQSGEGLISPYVEYFKSKGVNNQEERNKILAIAQIFAGDPGSKRYTAFFTAATDRSAAGENNDVTLQMTHEYGKAVGARGFYAGSKYFADRSKTGTLLTQAQIEDATENARSMNAEQYIAAVTMQTGAGFNKVVAGFENSIFRDAHSTPVGAFYGQLEYAKNMQKFDLERLNSEGQSIRPLDIDKIMSANMEQVADVSEWMRSGRYDIAAMSKISERPKDKGAYVKSAALSQMFQENASGFGRLSKVLSSSFMEAAMSEPTGQVAKMLSGVANGDAFSTSALYQTFNQMNPETKRALVSSGLSPLFDMSTGDQIFKSSMNGLVYNTFRSETSGSLGYGQQATFSMVPDLAAIVHPDQSAMSETQYLRLAGQNVDKITAYWDQQNQMSPMASRRNMSAADKKRVSSTLAGITKKVMVNGEAKYIAGPAALQMDANAAAIQSQLASAGATYANLVLQHEYELAYERPDARYQLAQQYASFFGGKVTSPFSKTKRTPRKSGDLDQDMSGGVEAQLDFGRGQMEYQRLEMDIQRRDMVANFAQNMTRMGWQAQDAYRERARTLTRAGWQREDFDLQRSQISMGRDMQSYSFGFQAREMAIGKQQYNEDFAYNKRMRQMQFGWQMEDADTNIRRATGFERKQLIKGKEREVISFNEETQQNEKVNKRQQEAFKREEEKFKKEIDHYKKSIQLEDEQFNKSVERFEQEQKWQEEDFNIQAGRLMQEQAWAEESFARQMERFNLETEQFELQKNNQQILADDAAVKQEAAFALADKTYQHSLAAAGAAAHAAKLAAEAQDHMERAGITVEQMTLAMQKFAEGTKWEEVSKAMDNIIRMYKMVNNIPDDPNSGQKTPGMQQNANGGYFNHNQSVLVGERGPEIITTDNKGRPFVIPNSAIPRGRSSSSGSGEVIHIHVMMDSDEIATYTAGKANTLASRNRRRAFNG